MAKITGTQQEVRQIMSYLPYEITRKIGRNEVEVHFKGDNVINLESLRYIICNYFHLSLNDFLKPKKGTKDETDARMFYAFFSVAYDLGNSWQISAFMNRKRANVSHLKARFHREVMYKDIRSKFEELTKIIKKYERENSINGETTYTPLLQQVATDNER